MTKSDIFKEVIDYLNLKTGKKFKYVERSKKFVNARVNEGFELQDFKDAIDVKTEQWLTNPKMSIYLRPETLFGTKMEGYCNEKVRVSLEDLTDDRLKELWDESDYYTEWFDKIAKICDTSYDVIKKNERLILLRQKYEQ